MLHALIVEDDESSLDALEQIVHGVGFETRSAQTLQQARVAVSERAPDLTLLDLDLPDGNGSDLYAEIRKKRGSEVIVITGHGSVDTAVTALRTGAADFMLKPIDVDRLDRTLADLKRSLQERPRVALPDDQSEGFEGLVGRSTAMRALYADLERVASTEVTVLLIGETGVGKECVAEALHRRSSRASGPLVTVNCGSLQPSLIESQLFGHEAGSFTGAKGVHRGLFERARGGTLFLDEVTEMPLDLQVNLLRVLESGRARRVGGDSEYDVDVRVVAATNRDPGEAVREGRLRKDLYFRLNVFPLRIPPLRERASDVALLAHHLARTDERVEGFSPESLERLQRHSWPGNVRELRNVVQRAAVLAEGVIEAEHIRLDDGSAPASSAADAPAIGSSIAEVERWLILRTLEQYDWNKKRAAEVLGISLKTLYTRLNAYGVQRGGRSG